MFGYVKFGLVWFDKIEIVITTSKSTDWRSIFERMAFRRTIDEFWKNLFWKIHL